MSVLFFSKFTITSTPETNFELFPQRNEIFQSMPFILNISQSSSLIIFGHVLELIFICKHLMYFLSVSM